MPRGGAAITIHPSTREFPASGERTGPHTGPRPGRPSISFGELRRLLAEDHAANDRSRLKWTVCTPGFQAIAVYRLGVWCHGLRPRLLRAPVRLAVGFLAFLVRTLYGIELFPTARIGRRLRIAHQHGIVIHPAAVIGDDCLIRQGVTIGGADDGTQAPRLGDRVKLGVGAVLAGPITVGDDVVIGPNAVVMVDVPARSIVTAPPARIMTPPPRRAPAAAEAALP